MSVKINLSFITFNLIKNPLFLSNQDFLSPEREPIFVYPLPWDSFRDQGSIILLLLNLLKSCLYRILQILFLLRLKYLKLHDNSLIPVQTQRLWKI